MLTPAYFCIDNFNGEAPTSPSDGVDENSMDVKAFPIPCQGQLHLSAGHAQEFDYQVFNMMGQAVASGHSRGETIVDLSQCPSGLYLISVTQDEKRLVKIIPID